MRSLREWSVALAWLLVLGLLAVRAPAFFHQNQLFSILCATAPVLIVACGMSLVIVSRQIDISVGSQFSMAGVLLGLLIQAGWPMPLAFLLTFMVGAVFG